MRATPTSAPFEALFLTQGQNGAGERNRTPDRLITNQLLYLLSYASEAWDMEQQNCPCRWGANHPLRGTDRQAFETTTA